MQRQITIVYLFKILVYRINIQIVAFDYTSKKPTSAVSSPSSPKTTHAWSSDNARWTSLSSRSWQAATTAYATPKQSSLFPGRERIFYELSICLLMKLNIYSKFNLKTWFR